MSAWNAAREVAAAHNSGRGSCQVMEEQHEKLYGKPLVYSRSTLSLEQAYQMQQGADLKLFYSFLYSASSVETEYKRINCVKLVYNLSQGWLRKHICFFNLLFSIGGTELASYLPLHKKGLFYSLP